MRISIGDVYLIILLKVLVCQYSMAQVSNDNIDNAIPLEINDTPYPSKTNHCTVQWNCVNEALTGKCIKYHNDQWFSFTTLQAKSYFINIANQDCRDIRGVQLVVIKGIPCDTTTYEIKACISLGNQDDIFVRLDSLKSHTTYLLNVDGYLHDFCSFNIQVSDKENGIPVQKNPNYQTKITIDKNEKYIKLHWQVDQDIASEMQEYRIFRYFTKNKKSVPLDTVPHQKNAFGESKLTYEFKDTLTSEGIYEYKVVGKNTNDEKFLLGYKELKYEHKNQFLKLSLPYKNNTPVTIIISDQIDNQMLFRDDFIFQKKNNIIFYHINKFLEQGIKQYEVLVINKKTNQSEKFYFDKR